MTCWHCLILSLALFTLFQCCNFLKRLWPCFLHIFWAAKKVDGKMGSLWWRITAISNHLSHSWNKSHQIIPLIYHQWWLRMVTHVTERENPNRVFAQAMWAICWFKKKIFFLFTLHPILAQTLAVRIPVCNHAYQLLSVYKTQLSRFCHVRSSIGSSFCVIPGSSLSFDLIPSSCSVCPDPSQL